jgi:hypothetical protein
VHVSHAVPETTFVQQFEVHVNVVVGEGTFAASYDDGHQEQLKLVHQSSLDRLRRKLGTAHRQVTVCCRLELPDRFRVEVSLDPGLGAVTVCSVLE